MTRICADWIRSYLEYTQHTEAPEHMRFWCGVSAVAGALRRKIWIDEGFFRWHCNMYICLVGPPGVVSKTTTAGTAMHLLRQVPDVVFGPDIVTWQALVGSFTDSYQAIEYPGGVVEMSALTLESGEFGNLLNPQDKEMVDLLVTLWDGKQGTFSKITKSSGTDHVVNPWINLLACTTPSWIQGNFPEYMIGGGFTSRMLFVYAGQKAKLVAYPSRHVSAFQSSLEQDLVSDLVKISQLCGPYKLTQAALEWGEAWYQQLHTQRPLNLPAEEFAGYFARKQTHAHKLALVLAACQSDEPLVTDEHLGIAVQMLTDLEPDMKFVFSRIGKASTSSAADRLIEFVFDKGRCSYEDAYRHVYQYFPSMREFDDIMSGCVRAGYVKIETSGKNCTIIAGKPPEGSKGSIRQCPVTPDAQSGGNQ
jgi:Protein of unknown function (DUF3987)